MVYGSWDDSRGAPPGQPFAPSEIEPEEEVDEGVAEVFVGVEDDGGHLADPEAAADVQAQDERRAEGGTEPEAVAAPGALRLVVLEPARAGVEEDRALDAGEADLAEREREREAVEDGEAPLLVDQPHAGARERVARVAAELVCSAENGAAGDGAIAVEAVQADRVRPEQRGAQVAPVVAEDDVVLRCDAACDLAAADLAGKRAVEARDEARGEVEALAVDGPRGQPERVVLDVGEVVGREEALAREIPQVRSGVGPQEAPTERVVDVHAIAALEPEPQLEAAELGERIAGEEVPAVGLFLVDVEDDVSEQPFEAEEPGAEVQPVREVQVQEVAAEVVDELAEVLRLRGGHAEEEDVVAEHVAREQLRALRRADARCDDRVPAGEVDGELPPLVVRGGPRARKDRRFEVGPRPAHGERVGVGRAVADDEAGGGRVGERDRGE